MRPWERKLSLSGRRKAGVSTKPRSLLTVRAIFPNIPCFYSLSKGDKDSGHC